MADEEHVALLKQGVEVWNKWRLRVLDIRVDLSGTDLNNANLREALLFKVDLREAHLFNADLRGADLRGADLRKAHLSEADLREAHLSGANLTRADLSMALLSETVFGNANLSDVKGLDSCRHYGPCTIDHRTLQRSGPLPLAFLRGVGLPDNLIDYLPSLLNQPIQFYSCFIRRIPVVQRGRGCFLDEE
jgi:hypothetical protein